jgi:phosphoribosyl-AMP cyclohydrolase
MMSKQRALTSYSDGWSRRCCRAATPLRRRRPTLPLPLLPLSRPQHVDTGELAMQAFADRAAINETLQTRCGLFAFSGARALCCRPPVPLPARSSCCVPHSLLRAARCAVTHAPIAPAAAAAARRLATFYSRSRQQRWCKGETSGNTIDVLRLYVDCDRDSLIYLSDPSGPSCHTGARSCWFSEASAPGGAAAGVRSEGAHDCASHVPATTLFALEQTIRERRAAMEAGTGARAAARREGREQAACQPLPLHLPATVPPLLLTRHAS